MGNPSHRTPVYLRADQWRTVLSCLDHAVSGITKMEGGAYDKSALLAGTIAKQTIKDIRPDIAKAVGRAFPTSTEGSP